MVLIQVARFANIFEIAKRIRKFRWHECSFYSDFKGSILHYVLRRSCYVIRKDSLKLGVLFINKSMQEIYYIPFEDKSVSFFRLLYMIKQNFNLSGFKLSVKHKNLNSNIYKNSFFIEVINDVKYMKIDTGLAELQNDNIFEGITVRNLKIGKEENVRVELQNRIFSEVKHRRALSVEEVLREEKSSGFLKGMCFILRLHSAPIGYGQILYNDGKFFLVNFGVIPEYRSMGYGHYFLSELIKNSYNCGINHLYLTVDKQNDSAVGLYRKIGFHEMYNKLEIILK